MLHVYVKKLDVMFLEKNWETKPGLSTCNRPDIKTYKPLSIIKEKKAKFRRELVTAEPICLQPFQPDFCLDDRIELETKMLSNAHK